MAPGGYPPGAPADPDVRNSRIRLLETRFRYVRYPWTTRAGGSGKRSSSRVIHNQVPLRHSDCSHPHSARLLSLRSVVPVSRRVRALPGSWATPTYLPCSTTPVGRSIQSPGLVGLRFGRSVVAFRETRHVGPTMTFFRGCFSTAHMRAVYASQSPSRHAHARLASGWRLPALAGWDFHPRVALIGFSLATLLSSDPRLSLAQSR